MRPSCRRLPRPSAWALALVGGLVPSLCSADLLPSRPLSLWNDRVVVSGEVTLTVGASDDGYFNAIDYSHDAFNLLTVALTAEVRAHDRLSVLAQVLDETSLRGRQFGPNDRHVLRPYALYLRVQPFADRPLTVRAGRVPPVFGAFARQDYGSGNPLIGLPLAYHYPTVIRPDAIPPTVDELVANRGSGWLVRYPRASTAVGVQGVPLVAARRWDTGVQAHWEGAVIVAAVSVTNGSLSKPLTRDDNDGKQLALRVAAKAGASTVIGVSLARGAFVSESALGLIAAPAPRSSFRQEAWGLDAEYSRGYVLLRGELVASRWETPFADGAPTSTLGARAGWLEARVKLTPRWSVAARGERLAFSSLNTRPAAYYRAGGGYVWNAEHERAYPEPPYETGPDWDAPVTRAEVAAGYLVRRNVRLKASYQYNWRDGGRLRREGLIGGQLVYWF